MWDFVCNFAENKLTQPVMVVQVQEITCDNIGLLLEKSYDNSRRKTLADIYGKFKRGIDGLEYQKAVRNEWN